MSAANVRRGGVKVSQLEHRPKREPVTHPAAHFMSVDPSPPGRVRCRSLTLLEFVIAYNYSGQEAKAHKAAPPRLLMESLTATIAQSDKEAKRRIRGFLDRKTAKVKPA
jgi:hypothetical protein